MFIALSPLLIQLYTATLQTMAVFRQLFGRPVGTLSQTGVLSLLSSLQYFPTNSWALVWWDESSSARYIHTYIYIYIVHVYHWRELDLRTLFIHDLSLSRQGVRGVCALLIPATEVCLWGDPILCDRRCLQLFIYTYVQLFTSQIIFKKGNHKALAKRRPALFTEGLQEWMWVLSQRHIWKAASPDPEASPEALCRSHQGYIQKTDSKMEPRFPLLFLQQKVETQFLHDPSFFIVLPGRNSTAAAMKPEF